MKHTTTTKDWPAAIAGSIPYYSPSLPMIMYGIITEENIGKLFIAYHSRIILMIVYNHHFW